MGLDPQRLFAALAASGIRSFAGVPCSILDHLTSAAEASDELDYLRASVEGEAVASAAGAWLAGRQAACLLQNSGLGNAVNPLASLAIPYRIPVLLVVSWRGEPGRSDAVHHLPMGRATPGLLELLGIPAEVLREDSDLEAQVAACVRHLETERAPAALIVPRGLFEASPGRGTEAGRGTQAGRGTEAGRGTQAGRGTEAGRGTQTAAQCSPRAEAHELAQAHFTGGDLPSRAEVLSAILERSGTEAAISTTGYMSRELGAHGDPDRHFPMQGSMGFALAIALGVCGVQPERRIFVLDGDGALLMRLGSLASVGAKRPRGLVHIVFDNGTYASTGGQPTVSDGVDFAGVAAACGYGRVATCEGRAGLAEALAWTDATCGSGPVFLRVRIDQRESSNLPRPKLTPPEFAERFRAWLVESGA